MSIHYHGAEARAEALSAGYPDWCGVTQWLRSDGITLAKSDGEWLEVDGTPEPTRERQCSEFRISWAIIFVNDDALRALER